MGQLVIAVYRPRAGKDAQLLELIRTHVPTLRKEGLATFRKPLVMRGASGAILEIFEWKSAEAAEQAHHNKAVLALWDRFGEVCESGTLNDLSEGKQPFAEFEPIDW